MGRWGQKDRNSNGVSNSYVKHIDLTKTNNRLNINDLGYNDIEPAVESFMLEKIGQTKTIITGSSNHMIEMVENVVRLHNSKYEVIENGIRIWKECA